MPLGPFRKLDSHAKIRLVPSAAPATRTSRTPGHRGEKPTVTVTDAGPSKGPVNGARSIFASLRKPFRSTKPKKTGE